MKTIIKKPVTVERVVEKVIEEKSEVVDAPGGPIEMLGSVVYVQCTSYSYTGELFGVNHTFIELKNANIVYATGAWNRKNFETEEVLPSKRPIVLFLSQIESMFVIDR
jgi:hypothetical protein